MNDFPQTVARERPSLTLIVNCQLSVGRTRQFFPSRAEGCSSFGNGGNSVLASAASLIWFINYYFLGPLLRIFSRTDRAGLSALGQPGSLGWRQESGLLLSVLLDQLAVFFIYHRGAAVLRQRRSPWVISIGLGTLLCVFGFFFGFGCCPFAGQDVWVYLITQVTELEWVFLKLGLLAQPVYS